MPVTVDTWLGGGDTPTQRLQEAWCGDPCLGETPPRWFDVGFTTVYMSHFLAGLTIVEQTAHAAKLAAETGQ